MLQTITNRVKPLSPLSAREVLSRHDWLSLKLSEPNLGAPYETGTYVLTGDNTGTRGWSILENKFLKPILVNTNFNALEGFSYLVDTTSNTVVATLPAAPEIGHKIYFQDIYYYWDVKNMILEGNGKKIQSLDEDFYCDLKGIYFEVTYAGEDVGWRIS